MPKLGLNAHSLPYPVEKAVKTLGGNISYARRRRGLKQAELARKAGITAVTLRRVENGNATTAIAAYFTALWALGLEREVLDIGAPERDESGKVMERSRSPQRIRSKNADFDGNF